MSVERSALNVERSGEAGRAVFLSYASQDADAARRICETLRAAGIEVWFDQSELRGGEAWDHSIRRQIRDCALFVPIVSAHTQERREGYFRLEWKLADERTHLMAEGTPFVLPVVVDATKERDALVPKSFLHVQWTWLPQGAIPPALVQRVMNLLSGEVGARASAPAQRSESPLPLAGGPHPSLEASEGRPPALPGKRFAIWAWSSLAIAAVAIGVWVLPRTTPTTLNPEPKTQNPEPAAAIPASAPTAPARAEVLSASEKSVVVLPFLNLSSDPDNAIFTEGMHLEAITVLSQLGDVKVISHTSAQALKGSTLSLAEIGQKLGVAHVVTGSVRREAGRVRVQLELRRAADEAVLWTKVFNQELKDVYAIQNEIATEAARVLQARDQRGTAAGARFMTKDPRVYDLFVKLRQEYDNRTNRSATGFTDITLRAEELVRLDPNFMPAVSILSTINTRIAQNATDPAVRVRHAEAAKGWAEKASALMPGGAGDGALAYYYTNVAHDYQRGLVLAQNLVRALPNDATSHNFLALALNGLGRHAEGILAVDRAVALDPLNSLFQNNRLMFLAWLRRHEAFAAAMAHWRSTLENAEPPNYSVSRYWLDGELPKDMSAALGFLARLRSPWLWQARRFDEARSAAEARLASPELTDQDRCDFLYLRTMVLRRLARNNEAAEAARLTLAAAEKLPAANEVVTVEGRARLALALMLVGRTDEAVATMRREIEAATAASQISIARGREVILAEIYAEAARPRECVELLAKLLRVPSPITVPVLRVSPTWDKVRDDAGFKALLGDPKNNAPL